jgi:hypothetical protein
MADTRTKVKYNSYMETFHIVKDSDSGGIDLDGIKYVKDVTPEEMLSGAAIWHLKGPDGYLKKSAKGHFFIGKGDPKSDHIEVRVSKSAANRLFDKVAEKEKGEGIPGSIL